MRKKYGKWLSKKTEGREKRRLSIREKVNGTSERPRVCATKSNKHLLVQVVDDSKSISLFTISTFGKSPTSKGCNIESAKKVGEEVAKKLKSNKVDKVVFDRAGYRYTGIVAALVQSIRDNGILV